MHRRRVACTLGAALAQPVADAPRRADAARMMNELMTGRVPIGGPFELPDVQGRRVGPAQWRGKIILLYFGYMYCPDACPTELSNIAAALEALGPDAAKVQAVFVTLDPERDAARQLGRYVEGFDSRFVALRGTPAQTRRIADAYKVYYEKVSQPGAAAYAIDHTSFTYLLDTQGRYVGYFPPATPGPRIAEQVRAVLGTATP